MKRSTLFSLATILLLIPATLFLGMQLSGRWYYLTGTLIILETMLPFFMSFEQRRPQARELVMIAVMAAIATVSRAAFSFLPHFKPITAIIMITGIAFGAEAGFLTGAIAAFASNFIFGQGPWTPWQMMAYGMAGFLAGVLLYSRRLPGKPLLNTLLLSVFGLVAVVCAIGPLLDCCTIFTTPAVITPAFVFTVLAAGLPVNAAHGLGCAVTMVLFSRPLLSKLERLKIKYGLLDHK